MISNYATLLRQVQMRVALAQQKAFFAANEELLRMYWELTFTDEYNERDIEAEFDNTK